MRQSKTGTPGPYFLATTALEDFWIANQPLLFLGEWCRLYRRRAYWGTLDGIVIQSHWRDIKNIEDGFKTVVDIYEELLPQLAKCLNQIHRVDQDLKYWRIVLGPWLNYFVNVFLDRFLSISQALAEFPDFETIVLCADSYITPIDTEDFVNLSFEDAYNIQLYSQILESLGKKFPSREYAVKIFQDKMVENPKGFFTQSKLFAKKILLMPDRYFKKKANAVLKDSYFSRSMEFKIWLKTGGLAWPDMSVCKSYSQQRTNKKVRSAISIELSQKSDLSRALTHVLQNEIPQCFIEGFKDISSEADARFHSRPAAIFSIAGWYWDEAFKQWAASSSACGTLLIGGQHGGNYGSLERHSSEDHEVQITDRYYTWGWDRQNVAAAVRPFISTKLSGRRCLNKSVRGNDILLVTNSQPRYLFQLPYTPNDISLYIDWQLMFIEKLDDKLRDALLVRTYFIDYDWGIRERMADRFPELAFENWDMSFFESLEKCRLYVGTNLGTTFLEALSAGKPTILFWDQNIEKIRPEAIEYYELLIKAGILWESPEKAAIAIGAIYDDVQSWWNEPSRQCAVEKFCNQFARTEDNGLDRWVLEFKSF